MQTQQAILIAAATVAIGVVALLAAVALLPALVSASTAARSSRSVGLRQRLRRL